MTPAAPSKFWAALSQRCPRCRRGPVFHGVIAMHETCPACGLKFEREPGYFMGAMYFSYFLSVAFLIVAFALGVWLLPGLAHEWIGVLATLVFLPFVPLVYRYSRVVWMYFDYWAWPSQGEQPRIGV